MKREKISQAVGNIDIRHIQEAEYYSASNNIKISKGIWTKTAAASAVILCAASVYFCYPAIAGSSNGFLKDIIRWWDGAVVGSEYENATDEIRITTSKAIVEKGNAVIPLEITFLEMGNKEPYIYLIGGEVSLGDYHIADAEGNELYSKRGQQETSGLLKDGTASFMQPLDIHTLSKDTKYKLVIESIYGLQKAEQPLKMKGKWECEFIISDQ